MPTGPRETEESRSNDADDPVLKMLGVGEEMWKHEAGDHFVARLRSEELTAPPIQNLPLQQADSPAQLAWSRIKQNSGKQFHTSRGLPFTYEVEGSGIWFFREGKRIERKLTRTQVDLAISRCPLRSTTEIKDLMDYAYLFALLMDRRIRDHSW
jgi:hypothetical protein